MIQQSVKEQKTQLTSSLQLQTDENDCFLLSTSENRSLHITTYHTNRLSKFYIKYKIPSAYRIVSAVHH